MKASGNFNPALASNHHCYDALIVGGGPAGLAAAIALRQRGLGVLVVEALQPPIDKACGEGLMPDSRAALANLGVELSSGREFYGIHFANRAGARESTVTAAFPRSHGIGIRRLALHQALMDRANEIGVQIEWGVRADLRDQGEVYVAGRRVLHRYLIGADGQASRVRSWAGLEAGSLRSRRLGFRRHYRFPSNAAPENQLVEVHWGQLGQAYVTPVAEDEICVAVVTRQTGLNFNSLLEDLPHLKQTLQGAQVIGRDRGAVTTTRKLRRVTRGNAALVGDASGSADAITGEGLASAFRQAPLLGDALSRDRIDDYEAGHPRILRLPQIMASVMLTMDRWPAWRDRVMRTLSDSPELFEAMLAVHVGELGFAGFAATHAAPLALRLLLTKGTYPRLASLQTAIAPDGAPADLRSVYPGREPGFVLSVDRSHPLGWPFL